MPVEMIEHFSMEPIVEKTRHCVDHGGPVWSVDVFRGLKAGLVLDEVELDRPDQPIDRSDWVGRLPAARTCDGLRFICPSFNRGRTLTPAGRKTQWQVSAA